MRHIGVTGTCKGLTGEQRGLIPTYLTQFSDGNLHVHHGDCIGADAEVHEVAYKWGAKIVIHPPIDGRYRAYCTTRSGIVYPKKDYIERNHDIVDACEVILAFPGEYSEQKRSGTWATIRYAIKSQVMMVIVYPNGTEEIIEPATGFQRGFKYTSEQDKRR